MNAGTIQRNCAGQAPELDAVQFRAWPVVQAGGNFTTRAFTLIELLVVVGIIGILAAIGLPALKGIGQANLAAAASRQMLDDLAFARLKALSDRTTVFMVFVPTNVGNLLVSGSVAPQDVNAMKNLLPKLYTSYALVSLRSVGDQPGQTAPRYLTDWKTLPDGMLIAPSKFIRDLSTERVFGPALPTRILPFPRINRQNLLGSEKPLPYIAFNAKGQLLNERDVIIPLVRGTVFYPRDSNGNIIPGRVPDVQLNPPRAGTNDFQLVRINWVTGRAKIEAPEIRE